MSCSDFQARNSTRNVVNITVQSFQSSMIIQVNAVTVGGWIVMQQRVNSSLNFNRTSKEYRDGFGDPASNFWIGNEALYRLTGTSGRPWRLRIELMTTSGNWYSAEYGSVYFDRGYSIYLGGFDPDVSDAGNGMSAVLNTPTPFTTYDMVSICSLQCGGGWWYPTNAIYCMNLSPLNGNFPTSSPSGGSTGSCNAVTWYTLPYTDNKILQTRMMIKQ